MTPRLIPALILALAALPAQAEVYKWVDAKGQVNYSNAPPPSVAGKAQQVEERISVMGMDPAVRAAAERRFAYREQQEELDWQQRQQRAMYVQTATPTPSPSYSSGYSGDYYPATYYGGYYGGYSGRYYGGYARRPIVNRPILGRPGAGFPPRVMHHSPRPAFHGGRSTRR